MDAQGRRIVVCDNGTVVCIELLDTIIYHQLCVKSTNYGEKAASFSGLCQLGSEQKIFQEAI